MFDSLSDKLQDTFKRLRGQARLSESNMTETLREIRIALLDADEIGRASCRERVYPRV